MNFSPAVHTKDFLLKNPLQAIELAMNSYDFANTDLANDIEILKLKDSEGTTVAHVLARFQRKWIGSASANNIEILSLLNNDGCSVAHELIENSDCLNLDALFSKRILTIQYRGKSIAEAITSSYSVHISLDEIMITLIKQGAAYKDSKYVYGPSGIKFINNAIKLIDDCIEPSIKFKYIHAVHSTILHNINYAKMFNHPDAWWMKQLDIVEKMFLDIIDEHPYLLEQQIETDFNCEPSVDFLNKIKAEKTFLNLTSPLDQLNTGEDQYKALDGFRPY